MIRKAIVLAGGRAERLPNKLLLPVRAPGIRLMIESSLTFLSGREVEEKDTVVVTTPSHVIKNVLRCIGYEDLKFVPQADALGVCDAIRWGAIAMQDDRPDRVIVVFGDNLYPMGDAMPKFTNHCGDFASVISGGKGCAYRPGLDYWCSKRQKWCHRDDPIISESYHTHYLAGFLDLTWETIEGLLYSPTPDTLPAWLNQVGCKPRVTAGGFSSGWRDLGTLDAYTYHWRSALQCHRYRAS